MHAAWAVAIALDNRTPISRFWVTDRGLLLVLFGETRAGAVLHDQIGPIVVGHRGLEDRDDIGMRGELGHDVGLGRERVCATPASTPRAKHLDRDPALGERLVVQEDIGKPPDPQQANIL